MKTTPRGYNLTIEVNDFNLSYDDLGEGNRPVIFLHGFPFDKTMWQHQLHYLKSFGRVIACDIRGFGKSTDEETPLSIALFGKDLIEFMDKLKIDKATICGLSMGGYIALNAFERSPERFEGLVLCDTQCIEDNVEAKEKRYNAIEQITKNGANDFNEAFIKKVFHEDSLLRKKEVVEQLRSVVFSNSQHIMTDGLRALAERLETCTNLPSITVPTLIICGKEDQLTPLPQSEFMNKNIKGSMLRVIEHAGHVSNLEQPDEFNGYLKAFLSRLGAN